MTRVVHTTLHYVRRTAHIGLCEHVRRRRALPGACEPRAVVPGVRGTGLGPFPTLYLSVGASPEALGVCYSRPTYGFALPRL